MLRLLGLAGVVLVSGVAVGQVVIATPVPRTISIGNLDSVISRARSEAIRTEQPRMEFEMVKLHIQESVRSMRVHTGQVVSFDTPGVVKAWLRSSSRRSGVPYDDLVRELADALAPHPVPDLNSEKSGEPDLLRTRALHNIRSSQAAVEAEDGETSAGLERIPAGTPAAAVAPVPTPVGPAGDPSKIEMDFGPAPVKK